MKYTTIIFDLDGTLLNTLDDLADSLNYALAKEGYATHTYEEVKFFVGSGIRVMIERALPQNIKNFDAVYQTFLTHYEKNKTNKTAPYQGVFETLAVLKAKGIRMAIVSNKYQQGVTEICTPLFGKYMDVMIGEQPGYAKKPSRDMVDLAMKQLQADPATTVYVGDSDIDVLTAQNAQLPCIGAAWGFRGEAFLKVHGVEMIAKTFSDILKFIQ
ncbi:MAG: HAD family hydrolase [Prevotella sp.]|nr:HAD family hydrolase [Staphylococcus sp.]MCM1350802.1 HAD family hydrolase [Prevotella sp.]